MIQYLLLFLSLINLTTIAKQVAQKEIIIMIDPAGDARHAGRTIGDSLERATTLNIAQGIKKQLESQLGCTVIITRSPGETIAPLQNATFSNRMNVDLYLSIHCYHAPQDKHAISLYTMSRGESLMPTSNELSLVPAQKAHWKYQEKSKTYAQTIMASLQQDAAQKFKLEQPIALPFAPLFGIQAPALGIEINCIDPQDVSLYVGPLSHAIKSAVSS